MTNEEALRIAQGLITDFKCESETMVEFCNVVIKALEQESKTGHWIDREIYDADRWKCSECGRTEPYKENYCPNCGARMLEPQESEE